MTVSRHRRRVTTTTAAALSVVGVLLAAVLGAIGVAAIANTEDGEVQGSTTPEDRFPDTPTGMIAVVDDAGSLASLAVFALRPHGDPEGGAGGTVVPVPVSADVSGGFGSERTPLDETVDMSGPATLADEVSALLGLTIDASVVVTRTDLATALQPLGGATVDLPDSIADAAGAQFPAGSREYGPEELAAILASTDTSASAQARYGAAVAAWRAIAGRIGAGLGEPLALGDAPEMRDAVGRLTTGALEVAQLDLQPLTGAGVNPGGVDAVALDRAEVVALFGHVAPSRLAAPNPGLNAVVRSWYADEQLPDPLTRYDVAYAATAALLDREANVLAVDTSAHEAEAATIVEVADESLVGGVRPLEEVFGSIEVRVAQRRIVGINVVVILGTDYLDVVAAAHPTSSVSSAPAVEEPAGAQE